MSQDEQQQWEYEQWVLSQDPGYGEFLEEMEEISRGLREQVQSED